MGCNFGSNWESLDSGKEEKWLLMLGLDNAGKTSLMYRMKDNAFSEQVPTVGLNMETAVYKSYSLTVWDVGGKARNMWKHYFEENSAVAFVIDATDLEWLVVAKMELWALLSESVLKDVPFLVYLNKQDLISGEWVNWEDIS